MGPTEAEVSVSRSVAGLRTGTWQATMTTPASLGTDPVEAVLHPFGNSGPEFLGPLLIDSALGQGTEVPTRFAMPATLTIERWHLVDALGHPLDEFGVEGRGTIGIDTVGGDRIIDSSPSRYDECINEVMMNRSVGCVVHQHRGRM